MPRSNSQLAVHSSPKTLRILAVETSCDETAAAIVEGDGTTPLVVRSNAISSQVAIHAEYGGVFPDLAAREHTRKIYPILSVALAEAGLIDNPTASGRPIQEALRTVDAIAVTVGPGLIGPLLVGTNAAIQLAQLAGKPLIPINHWEGHLYSVFLRNTDRGTKYEVRSTEMNRTPSVLRRASRTYAGVEDQDHQPSFLPKFPILFLTVSGGHTSLILMRDHFDYEILGQTIDDAAGEAFDKCARLLGLPYPGGPALSQEAAEVRRAPGSPSRWPQDSSKVEEARGLRLPRPMLTSDNLNFSFSGLKTAVRYAIDRGEIDPSRRDLLGGGEQQRDSSEVEEPARAMSVPEAAREVEDAVVDVLLGKLEVAIEQTQPASVAIVGGVSANAELRRRFVELLKPESSKLKAHLPDGKYTTDNAAMIGAAGLFRFLRREGTADSPLAVTANASLRLV